MAVPLLITVFSTYLTIPSDKWGYLPRSPVNIRQISGKFVEFEFRQGQKPLLKQRFTLFNEALNLRIMPRHALPLITDYLTKCSVNYEIIQGELIPPRTVDIPINPEWKEREYQIPVIEFLLDQSKPMRVLDLDVGLGKTGCSVKASSALGYCTVIMVSGLVEQWEEVFRNNTLLEHDDIYVIKGSKSLIYLFANPEYLPKVFIASSETIKPYVVGAHDPLWPTWDMFCHHYGVGTKIMDECHLRFLSNTEIDLNTRIVNNLYLSATPSRSSSREKQIFALIFPDSIHYAKGPVKKYVDTFFYRFNIDINIREKRITTIKGYSHSKYETYLWANKLKFIEWIQTVIYPAINAHYINRRQPGHKCLIFVSTILMAEKLVEAIRRLYPDIYVHTYLSRDPESILTDADIIISTHKSAGTGSDIKGLLTCINTCSYQTDIQTRQQTGRLRELPDATPVMVDMANMFFNSHSRHAQARMRVYEEISNTFKVIDLY
jgi:superfamily II DNA or RNA helicase